MIIRIAEEKFVLTPNSRLRKLKTKLATSVSRISDRECPNEKQKQTTGRFYDQITSICPHFFFHSRRAFEFPSIHNRAELRQQTPPKRTKVFGLINQSTIAIGENSNSWSRRERWYKTQDIKLIVVIIRLSIKQCMPRC